MTPPVIPRIEGGAILLDLRSVSPEEDIELGEIIADAWHENAADTEVGLNDISPPRITPHEDSPLES